MPAIVSLGRLRHGEFHHDNCPLGLFPKPVMAPKTVLLKLGVYTDLH